jgi:WD40 repeat protein
MSELLPGSLRLQPAWRRWRPCWPGLPLLLGVLLSTAACGEARPPPTPTSTATPTVQVATASITPTPTVTPPPPTLTPTLTSTPSRALRDVGSQEALVRVAEFPVPRIGFAVRMVFSPNEPVLYHTGVGLEIQGFDFGVAQVVFRIRGFAGNPLILQVSPQGDRIAAEDGSTVAVWDLASSEQVGSMQMSTLLSPLSGGFVGSEYFYADDEGGNLALWETSRWEPVERLSYAGRSDGSYVLPDTESVAMVLRGRREISIMDWSGMPIRTVPLAAEPWRLLSISPLGDQAALHVDVGKGTEGVLITDLGEGGAALRIPLLNIGATAMSPDWRTLAVTDGKEILRLFDPATGAQFYSQQLEAFQVKGLAFSPDGSLLAVHFLRADSTSGWIQIWGREVP